MSIFMSHVGLVMSWSGSGIRIMLVPWHDLESTLSTAQNKLRKFVGAGEMARRLRMPAAFAEHSGSVPLWSQEI